MKVGISGHQNIRPESAILWVAATIREELRKRPVLAGISCLAAGADQIFASTVLEMGIKLEVVLPCLNYESAFADASSKERFSEMYRRADCQHRLEYSGPSEEAFHAAGKRVVDLADLMIFVWDGLPARGLGGTADIVDYARAKRRPFIHLNPKQTSIQIHGLK